MLEHSDNSLDKDCHSLKELALEEKEKSFDGFVIDLPQVF